MAKSEMRQYIESTQSLPADCILGYITWFSVPDSTYDQKIVADLFDSLHLNPALLPPPIKSINAFKKACTEHSGKLTYDAGDGKRAEVMLREVYKDNEQIQMHLVREIRDGKNKVLDYVKVGEIVFYRDVPQTIGGRGPVVPGSARIRTSLDPTAIHPNEQAKLQELLKSLDARFVELRDFLDGDKVRGILRKYVKYLNGVMMKDSVYFVHETRADELRNLQQFAHQIDCTMSLLQMPDLQSLREDVVEAFQQEAERELNGITERVQYLRASRGTLTPALLTTMRAEYDGVIRKATEYSRVLSISQSRTAGAAELAVEAIAALTLDVLNGPTVTPTMVPGSLPPVTP